MRVRLDHLDSVDDQDHLVSEVNLGQLDHQVSRGLLVKLANVDPMVLRDLLVNEVLQVLQGH
jgi:hypothetical protein